MGQNSYRYFFLTFISHHIVLCVLYYLFLLRALVVLSFISSLLISHSFCMIIRIQWLNYITKDCHGDDAFSLNYDFFSFQRPKDLKVEKAQACPNAKNNPIRMDEFVFQQLARNQFYLNSLIRISEVIDTEIYVRALLFNSIEQSTMIKIYLTTFFIINFEWFVVRHKHCQMCDGQNELPGVEIASNIRSLQSVRRPWSHMDTVFWQHKTPIKMSIAKGSNFSQLYTFFYHFFSPTGSTQNN